MRSMSRDVRPCRRKRKAKTERREMIRKKTMKKGTTKTKGIAMKKGTTKTKAVTTTIGKKIVKTRTTRTKAVTAAV